MEISLRIDKNELDASLLEKIKALTKTRIIEIRISDELDETSYLCSVPIDLELYSLVEKQAKMRGVKVETLINLWVHEKLAEL